MSPYEVARAVFDREPCARTFEQDLTLHFLHGFVFSTPDFFIMGRSVRREAPHVLILNPAHTFPRVVCDCWHIYLMAGDITRAWEILPWDLPWFSFERKNDLRFYPAARIRELSLPDTEVLHQCVQPPFSPPTPSDSRVVAAARPRQ